MALAIISQVEAPTKTDKHRADLYIEAMQKIPGDELQATKSMMLQLQRMTDTMTSASATEPMTSEEAAGIKRLCREIGRYPTCPPEMADAAMSHAGA